MGTYGLKFFGWNRIPENAWYDNSGKEYEYQLFDIFSERKVTFKNLAWQPTRK